MLRKWSLVQKTEHMWHYCITTVLLLYYYCITTVLLLYYYCTTTVLYCEWLQYTMCYLIRTLQKSWINCTTATTTTSCLPSNTPHPPTHPSYSHITTPVLQSHTHTSLQCVETVGESHMTNIHVPVTQHFKYCRDLMDGGNSMSHSTGLPTAGNHSMYSEPPEVARVWRHWRSATIHEMPNLSISNLWISLLGQPQI